METEKNSFHEQKPLTQGLVQRSLPLPRLLLVDDDLTFGKIMSKIAHREGIPLTYFSSVRDISRLSRVDFDVGIFDYDLGSITGLQLGDFLDRYLKRIPVLLVSQYRHIPQKSWPSCVKNFVSKSNGSYQIFAEALKVHEETLQKKVSGN